MFHDDRVVREYRRDRRRFPRDDRRLNETDGGRPPVPRERLERQVYCHNFPFRSSWQDLKDYMRTAGEVEHVKIMEGPTGRSRGCAVVTYMDNEGAKKAVETIHGTQFQGRSIMVRENRTASFLKTSDGGGGEDSSRYRQNYQRNRYEEDHYNRDRERSPPPARDTDRYYRRSPPRSSPPVDKEREFRGPRDSRRFHRDNRHERTDDHRD